MLSTRNDVVPRNSSNYLFILAHRQTHDSRYKNGLHGQHNAYKIYIFTYILAWIILYNKHEVLITFKMQFIQYTLRDIK